MELCEGVASYRDQRELELKPERLQYVERIFSAAIEKEPQERAAFLDRECGGDSWLRQKVEALIIAHESAGSFLESPAVEPAHTGRTLMPNRFLGRQLGTYEVLTHLGSGGMGDVYRARDTKLKRDVALKILPPEFSRDPDRVARFQREAVTLAALNHSKIAGIYDLQEIDGTQFLVLEFVEGETLAARLKRGPLPAVRAVEFCKGIAEGLEAAHSRGIHHRDLKPDNVQITPDDHVKLLDFGLAKILAPDGQPNELTVLPSITQWSTKPGAIMGTATYLSPEQARGRQPDKRSDIWAFGCVLFEALTGKQAFSGDTVADVLAAILKNEPDWNLLPSALPSSVRSLLEQCLQKEPSQRLQDIAAARNILETAFEDAPALAPQNRPAKHTSWLTITTVAVMAAVLAALATWNFMTPNASNDSQRGVEALKPVSRLSLALPPNQQIIRTLTRAVAISPDGANVVYVSNDRIYMQGVTGDARPLPGVERVLNPAFSPDGQWLAFWSFTDRTLKKVSITGGPAVTLTNAPVPPSALNWTSNHILYTAADKGILAVSDAGGAAEIWVVREPDEVIDNPQVLDDGDLILFSATKQGGMDRWDRADIVLFSRKTGERKILLREGSNARYVSTGHIVFARGTVLYAVPFDLKRRQVQGEAAAVIEDLLHTVQPYDPRAPAGPSRTNWPFAVAHFDFSPTGTLVYIPSTSVAPGVATQYGEIRVVVNWFDELRRKTRAS